MMRTVELPPALNARVEWTANGDLEVDPEVDVTQFTDPYIVLSFGNSEIGRWPWESLTSLDECIELNVGAVYVSAVVTDFIAEKLRTILFPVEVTGETARDTKR